MDYKTFNNMNSIFRIYESLLGKTSDKVKRVGLDVIAMAGNEQSSDLRRFFGIPNWVKDPFSVDGNTLVANLSTGTTTVTSEYGPLSELIGNKFNKLRLYGLTLFRAMNFKDIVHTDIEAEEIRFDEDCTIEDVNIKTIPGPNKHYPIIMMYGNTVKDSTLEIDYSKVGESFGYIRSVGIPTFINVKSDSIPGIRIESRMVGESLIKDPRWGKIFEFGYKLGYRTTSLDKFRFTTIKSMDDLHKLVKSKQFRTRDYDQFPYRIKKGVKLADFLDISQFKNLKRVVVTNGIQDLIQITFEKVDSCPEKDSIVSKYPMSILIRERKEYIFGNPDLMLQEIPVTADGWRVLINGQ